MKPAGLKDSLMSPAQPSETLPVVIHHTLHASILSNSPGMMQTCLWRHYHEKAPPSRCTYLTSDLPFVPPRQQIAAAVVAGPSPTDRRTRPLDGGEEWVGVSQSCRLKPKSIPIHLPMLLHKHTPPHAPTLLTRQAGGLCLSSLSLPPCSHLHPLFLSEF